MGGKIIEAIGLNAVEHLPELVPIVVALLRDTDHKIVRQSIVIGTHFFCGFLEEMAVQFHWYGKVERWLDDPWKWMLRFKDSVFAIALKPGSVGTKLLALKFLETYVLLFTKEPNDSEKLIAKGRRQVFNISWLVSGHPVLDPVALMADANKTLGILLNFLQSPSSLPASLTIAVVNCLAAIARKRPVHYGTILSTLLDFDSNFEVVKECHASSIQYSLRTAFLGFLQCTYPDILETREKLLRALRAMNAGDVADQVIRQVDKMIKNIECASREARFGRNDQLLTQLAASGDRSRKRYPLMDEVLDNGYEAMTKRICHGPNVPLSKPIKGNDSEQDFGSVNGASASVPSLDSDLTPADKMIAMIGALLAEGDRGAESLELLISTIHPDLLADIVIVNMKHLPKIPLPLTKLDNLSVSCQPGYLSSQTQVTPSVPTNSTPAVPTVQASFPAASAPISLLPDLSTVNNLPTDSKCDPRRDPRRVPIPSRVTSEPTMDEAGSTQLDSDGSATLSKLHVGSLPTPLTMNSRSDNKSMEDPLVFKTDQSTLNDEVLSRTEEVFPSPEVNASSDHISSPLLAIYEDCVAKKLSDSEVNYGTDMPSFVESDEHEHSSAVSNTSATEETCKDLPELPLYVEMMGEQEEIVGKLAIERIIESHKHLPDTSCNQIRTTLLSRLIALNDSDDDIVRMLQKYIVVDYGQKKGHELILHILYHLYSLMVQDSVDNFSDAAVAYEKFLLAVAKSLLDTFPASDKSFSRLLGEVPVLPALAFKLLDDLCYSDIFDSQGKEVRDSERVTQGLGAVWGLILGRPSNRQACLDIALKCAVHSQDDIRAKAIWLVANKLYQLDYISENIKQFSMNMLLSAVDQHTSEAETSLSGSIHQREGEAVTQEASVSGSQISEVRNPEADSMMGAESFVQSTATMSFPEAQRHISLFFALCTKKPNLLQLVFDVYGQAPKTVKQVIHHHVPIVVKSLGSSYSELLRIMSDPPEGCENLLMLTTPSTDLIATVKHLYETKLKDATILIPILSSLSKDEVLQIFPRLVSLPMEKFQMALAHILQGSAHTGPALTPAEVLVAIHDISPEKDGLALKKITNACTACFEQRTVFTQQVLAKALNQMVDQIPLPLLFMRTVIQAIDVFPSLVDFVMEILSKLVNRQLPPSQLESALNKHANLRGSLASYASQPSIKASLPRPTLAVLGLANESHMQQPHVSSLHASTTSSVTEGVNLT